MNAALSDPEDFIKHGDNLMIIDEIQRAPLLLQAIKGNVDAHPQGYGRFLLTGSSNIQSLPQVTESLAGRVRTIRLRPISMGEYFGASPTFLKNAFKEKFTPHKGEYDKSIYLSLAFTGGYPEALHLTSTEDARQWHKDYLKALIERDLKEITNIRRKDSMRKLLEYLAAWSSKFMNLQAINSSLGIPRPTIESYINALETLYLVERIPSWTKTDYELVGKKDKFFMTDTGLMASLLKWQLEKVRLDGDKNGKLLETFVFTQLATLIDLQENDYDLYHYRDHANREIDFLVENKEGDYLGIEVKAGTAISQDSFKHLKWFKDNLAKKKEFIGIVLYTGTEVLPFGKGLWAVPISALWG
tara:strand:- start:89835 stop:90908 length:1074 start_codon:yes stop_codon:yes gene_type:complete